MALIGAQMPMLGSDIWNNENVKNYEIMNTIEKFLTQTCFVHFGFSFLYSMTLWLNNYPMFYIMTLWGSMSVTTAYTAYCIYLMLNSVKSS